MDMDVYNTASEKRKHNSTIILPPLEALEEPFQTLLDILYILTAILAFILNIFALFVILMSKRTSTELKKYLSNLAIVDLLIAVFSIPFAYTDFMYGRWLFPTIMCPIYNFISTTAVFVNIYTLVGIGFGRYAAIVHPFDSLSNLETRSTQIILLIWVNGMLVASPLLYQARAVQFTYGEFKYYDCRELWEGQPSAKIYTIVLFAVLFIIPLILLTFLYGSIGYKMIKRTAPGNADNRRDEAQNIMTFKLIKMLITLVTAFAICWFPLQLFNLIFWVFNHLRRNSSKTQYYVYIGTYFLCHWLSTAHSFINPIIYCVMSNNFKWSVVRNILDRKLNQRTTIRRRTISMRALETNTETII